MDANKRKIDSLKGAASKDPTFVRDSVTSAHAALASKDENLVRYAVEDRKVLPDLVGILDRDFGGRGNDDIHKPALEALAVIAESQGGCHIQAILGANPIGALLRIVHLKNEKVVGYAMKNLVLISRKAGVSAVFPPDFSMKSIIDLAQDSRFFKVCLALIESLLRDRSPSLIDAESCVRFIHGIDIRNVLTCNETMKRLRDCVAHLTKLDTDHPGFLSADVSKKLTAVRCRIT